MKRLFVALAFVVTACSNTTTSPSPSPAGSPPATSSPSPAVSQLTVMTHDAFAMSDAVKAAFEQQNNVSLNILRSGDAGEMVNKAILAKGAPLADVMCGVDNPFLSRALDAGIFEPYQSPALANIPAEFKVDPQNRVSPVDFGDVCLNYDTTAMTGSNPPPSKVLGLTDPNYKDQLVVENPATSSPGLAFLLATVALMGDPRLNPPSPSASILAEPLVWHLWWQSLKANGVLVSDDWEDAYYNQFSGPASQGDRPIVVSYATSPASEVITA